VFWKTISSSVVLGLESEAEAEVKLIPVEKPEHSPQAIPTITTRVNYDGQGSVDESFSESVVDREQTGTDIRASDKSPESVHEPENVLPIVAEVMADTEEISDGEVPSDNEEEMEDLSKSA